MSYEFQFDGELLYISLSGAIFEPELFAFAQEIRKLEAGLEKAPDRIIDISGIVTFHPKYDAMRKFSYVQQNLPLKNSIKSALVAPSDLQFGIARVFQQLNDNIRLEIGVFRDKASAMKWLAGRR